MKFDRNSEFEIIVRMSKGWDCIHSNEPIKIKRNSCNCEVYEEIKRALEMYDKYRIHNLMYDRCDLPELGKEVLVFGQGKMVIIAKLVSYGGDLKWSREAGPYEELDFAWGWAEINNKYMYGEPDVHRTKEDKNEKS